MANEQIREALQTVFNKQKNIDIFTNEINEVSKSLKEGKEEREEDNDTLSKDITYQTCGLLLQQKYDNKDILKQLKKKKVLWSSTSFEQIESKLQEHDQYLVQPFDVVDGVVECPKCKKSKTWSIQKQTRGADEPMTTFSKCVSCGFSWAYAG